MWRNRLARSAVNRKVAGSSPARCEHTFFATELEPNKTNTIIFTNLSRLMNDVDCCRHSKLLGIEFLEPENDLCQRCQCGLLVDVLLIVVISERLRDGMAGRDGVVRRDGVVGSKEEHILY